MAGNTQNFLPSAAICLLGGDHSVWSDGVVFWLLYHNMWAPLVVVLVTYTVSALINPILLMLIYVLLSIYFHKAQTILMRSYGVYLDYTCWFVFAERSTRKAQERLRRFDEKCRF